MIQNCSCNKGCWGQNGESCQACAPGTYKTFQGCVSCQNLMATDCAACPLGTASNNSARPSVCPSCAPGYYQDTLSLTTCKACAAGTYQQGLGVVSVGNCTACAVGTYSTTVASGNVSLCLPCPLGQYCATVGLTAPVNCTAGMYAGVTGQRGGDLLQGADVCCQLHGHNHCCGAFQRFCADLGQHPIGLPKHIHFEQELPAVLLTVPPISDRYQQSTCHPDH